ncbi:MAG: tyrosine-type recombinase/integrase [Ardenticatenaceae bacterium]|nr:tyrosine-type recombinase/integrase [Ardenticatenaceae bacterium]
MKLEKAFAKFLDSLRERQLSAAYVDEIVTYRLGRFVNPRSKRDIQTITRAEIGEHFTELRQTGLAEATLAGYTTVHKTFWRFCYRKKWVKQKLWKRLKRANFDASGPKAVPRAHLQKVIECLAEFATHRGNNVRDLRDALTVSLSIDSGCRLGELHNLQCGRVRKALERGEVTADGRIVYHITSTGKEGEVELRFYTETAELLQSWLNLMPDWGERSKDRLFINLFTGDPLKRKSLSRAFERVCRFAGVPVFRSHSVRHRNVTDIVEFVGDPKAAQVYANHADVTTTMKNYKEVQQRSADNAGAVLASRRRGPAFDRQMAQFFGLSEEEES